MLKLNFLLVCLITGGHTLQWEAGRLYFSFDFFIFFFILYVFIYATSWKTRRCPSFYYSCKVVSPTVYLLLVSKHDFVYSVIVNWICQTEAIPSIIRPHEVS